MKVSTTKINDLNIMAEQIVIPKTDLNFMWSVTSEFKNDVQAFFQLIISNEQGQTVYSSGKVATSDNHFHIEQANLSAHTTYSWQVKVTDKFDHQTPWSKKMFFTTALDHWDAQWIEPQQSDVTEEEALDLEAMFGGGKLPKQTPPDERLRPVQFLRKNFQIKKAVVKAQLFMTAHGIYQPIINGQQITSAQFMPDFTPYQNILQYQYFDITDFIGIENEWQVVLADGWYAGRISTTGNGAQFGNKTGILGEIILTYTDGTQDIVATDTSFIATTGKYQYSDIFIGEKQDLRVDTGWSKAKPVVVVETKKDNLVPQLAQYVERLEPIKAQKIWYDDGDLLVDFGQVLAGRVRMNLFLAKGQELKVEHAEVLDESGHFFNNITGRNKDQTDYFIGRGQFETLEPDFTFHGFRYVRLTGLKTKPELADLMAIPLTTKMPEIGSIRTSDERINQLIKNIKWSQRSNMLSIPTDCPQRERAGWTGDAQVFMPTAIFNMDVSAMMKRWLKGVRSEQRQDGQIQDYSPAPKEFYTSSPQFTGTYSSAGWGDAIIMIPWVLYKNSGDKVVLEQNYEAMKRWHQFGVDSAAQNKNKDFSQYIWDTKFHYGDWMFPSYMLGKAAKGPMATAQATQKLVGTAFLGYSSKLLAQVAKTLGKDDEAKAYGEYSVAVGQAFQKEFWDSKNSQLTENFQGCYVLAVAFDLLDAKTTDLAVQRLVEMVHANHDCLDTGFLSVPYLLDVLKDHGEEELAETILLQTKMPSWLYEVEHGATTVWESWGGIAPDGTVGSYSFNHYAFGCVENWIVTQIGGLQEKVPGYREFKIEIPAKTQFTSSSLTYHSDNGLIKISWSRTDNQTTVQVQIPFNTKAEVIFADQKKIVGSGDYEFLFK